MSKLSDMRNKAIEKGMPLLSEDEVLNPKPLRWRTGPVPEGHEDAQFLIEAKEGYILAKGYAVLRREYWIPLSEILELVDEE